MRLDGNISSDRDRFLPDVSGSRYFESLFDWTYEAPDPKFHDLHSDDMRRYTWAYQGNWTRTAGASSSTRRSRRTGTARGTTTTSSTTTRRDSVGLPPTWTSFVPPRGDCKLPM